MGSSVKYGSEWGKLSTRMALRSLENKKFEMSEMVRMKSSREVGKLEWTYHISPDDSLEDRVPQEAQMQNLPAPPRSSMAEFLQRLEMTGGEEVTEMELLIEE